MRLVTNTPYNTVLASFHGIENPRGWSLDSPAVWHAVANSTIGNNTFNVPGSINISGSDKWLLFLAKGGITYTIERDQATGIILRFRTYDYINTSRQSLSEDTAIPMHTGQVNYGTPIGFSFDKTQYVIVRFDPMTERDVFEPGSSQMTTRVSFSPKPISFSYDDKIIRDWAHRIDGTSWSAAGRLNRFDCLSEISRTITH